MTTKTANPPATATLPTNSDAVETRLSEADDFRMRSELRALAIRISDEWKTIPDWKRPFMVAKTMRGYLPKNESATSIAEWCRVFSVSIPKWNEFELTIGVQGKWDVVENGGDAWDSAWNEARKLTIRFEPEPEPELQRFVTAMYLLASDAEGEAFPIPTKRMARTMGHSHQFCSSIRAALVKRGIISNSGEGYSFKSGKADTFVFAARVVPPS